MNQNNEITYRSGDIWMDMSSERQDDKVDFYIKSDKNWLYLGRDFPIHIRKPFIPMVFE